jgi:hypothetical protein
MPDEDAPLSLCSTAPYEAAARLAPESIVTPEWPPSLLVMERMRAHLSMCPAICGNSSLMRMPETLVGMVP